MITIGAHATLRYLTCLRPSGSTQLTIALALLAGLARAFVPFRMRVGAALP